ncbi:MAG: hypothetical protein WCJ30_09070 [Deltaproteobacteria bacterium]
MNPLRLAALWSASVLCACTGLPIVEPADATFASLDAAASDSAALEAWTPVGACPSVPFVVGAFERVYAPSNGRYLNDHTVVHGPDGWHVYGITNTGPGMPQEERSFLHATAPSLFGPWRDLADILTADPALSESVLWAPYAFLASPGRWAMFYWGGVGMRVATSTDLFAWERRETHDDPSQRPPGGRDPFVFRTSAGWLLYSVGQSDAVGDRAHGRILVSRGSDPENAAGWTAPTTALEDPVVNYPWGNLESPFVVANECGYYLFLTRTDVNADHGDYARTMVFFSHDPMSFAWDPITELTAHAAEIVTDEVGRQYVTRAGWPAYIGEPNRGLSIARLAWSSPEPVADR